MSDSQTASVCFKLRLSLNMVHIGYILWKRFSTKILPNILTWRWKQEKPLMIFTLLAQNSHYPLNHRSSSLPLASSLLPSSSLSLSLSSKTIKPSPFSSPTILSHASLILSSKESSNIKLGLKSGRRMTWLDPEGDFPALEVGETGTVYCLVYSRLQSTSGCGSSGIVARNFWTALLRRVAPVYGNSA